LPKSVLRSGPARYLRLRADAATSFDPILETAVMYLIAAIIVALLAF